VVATTEGWNGNTSKAASFVATCFLNKKKDLPGRGNKTNARHASSLRNQRYMRDVAEYWNFEDKRPEASGEDSEPRGRSGVMGHRPEAGRKCGLVTHWRSKVVVRASKDKDGRRKYGEKRTAKREKTLASRSWGNGSGVTDFTGEREQPLH
jgi:hypothetical protein